MAVASTKSTGNICCVGSDSTKQENSRQVDLKYSRQVDLKYPGPSVLTTNNSGEKTIVSDTTGQKYNITLSSTSYSIEKEGGGICLMSNVIFLPRLFALNGKHNN